MPTKKNDPLVPVTRDIVTALRKHHRRTGIAPLALLKKQNDVPKGLSASEVTSWINSKGADRTARKSHLDYVLKCWSSAADKKIRRRKKEKRIVLTDDIIDELRAEILRTGIGGAQLLRGRRTELPLGLNRQTISNWTLGKVGTIRVDYLDYALKLWKSLPDESDVYIKITDEMRENLKLKLKKTGLSPKRLFAHRNDLPEGLAWHNIRHFIKPSTKRLKRKYHEFFIRICDEHNGQGYEEITQEIRERIQNEIDRTGIRIYHLLRRASVEQKNHVKGYTVKAWLNGSAQKANKCDIDYILGLYAKTPDKPTANKPKYPDKNSTRVNPKKVRTFDLRFVSLFEIPQTDIKMLRDYRDQYKILPSKIFKYAKEPPPSGVNSYMIRNWLGGRTKRADPDHIKWVLHMCQEWVKFQAE